MGDVMTAFYDFGFDLGRRYPDFKDYGKCYLYYMERIPGAQVKIAKFLNKNPSGAVQAGSGGENVPCFHYKI